MKSNTNTILAAITQLPGADHHALAAATGLGATTVQRALDRLRVSGQVLVVRFWRSNSYFADQEAKDALLPEMERRYAAERAIAKRQTAAKDAARAATRREANALPYGVSKPKLAQPKPMNKDKAARQSFAAQEALNPGVVPQQCPGFSGKHRFEADPGSFGGGFVAEWRQLRGAA